MKVRIGVGAAGASSSTEALAELVKGQQHDQSEIHDQPVNQRVRIHSKNNYQFSNNASRRETQPVQFEPPTLVLVLVLDSAVSTTTTT